MKLRSITAAAIALVLSTALALAQSGQGSSPLTIVKGGTNAITAAAARTSLGVAIGSNVQAWDADLDCLAALSSTGILRRTGSGTCSNGTVVAVTEGGTGLIVGVSGGIPYFSTTTAMTSSALLAQYGIMIGGGASAAPSTIAACTSAQLLIGQSTAPTCNTVTGDVTISNAGVTAIGTAKVTSAMMRNSGALSVIGRSANSSGVPGDISCTAASDGVLRESGSVLGCGTIATAGIANNAVTLAKLATQAANTALMNVTSGAAVPTAFAMPSCSTAGSALIYTTNTGPGCNTAITAAAVPVGGITGLGTGVATGLAINIGSAGAPVLFNGAGGTPSAITLTNGTGLPIAGISGLGTGVAGWLGTPSSANLATALTDETGSGALVFGTAPTISGLIATGVHDVQGTLKLSSFVTSTQIAANTNNFTATDGSNTCTTKTTLRISTDASRNITGLSCGQAEGDVRIIHNVGAFPAVLTNQDTNSTAANRFLFSGDMTLAADTSMTIRYDGVASRWRQFVTPGAGGGGGGVTSATIQAGTGISVSGTCVITSTGTCTVNVSGLSTNTPLTLGAGNAVPFAGNVTNFAGFGSICGAGGESGCYVPISQAVTLKNLQVTGPNGPGSGQTYVYTLRTGNSGSLSDSSVTCTVSNTSTTCSDTTHSVAVTAGQMVSVKMVSSAGATTVNGPTFGLTAVTTSP